jgi:SAM-dependent methyltransferase
MIEIRHADKDETQLQQAYDRIYKEGTLEHEKSYYRWILKQLRTRPGSRLLDVCCGTGKLADLARQERIFAFGADFSHVAVQQATSPMCVSDALELPFADQTFDYVVNLGSLEHLSDMRLGVREMARVLKPSGDCCVLVPNTFGLLWTIRVAKWTGEIDDDGQPLQRYGTRGEWQRLLNANGLVVRRVIGYELPPPNSARMWKDYLANPWMKLIPLLMWRFIPINLASMFVFFCGKSS